MVPSEEVFFQLVEYGGLGGAEVGGFVGVGDEVVEFEGASCDVLGDDFVLGTDEGGFGAEAEGEGFGAGGGFGGEERFEADAVEGLDEAGVGEADDVCDGREEVDGAGGMGGDAGFDDGGPFHDAGDAEAAFKDGAFVTAEAAGGVGFDFGEAAVVAVEDDEGVVGDAEVAEFLAEGADAAVHGDEFAVVIGGGGVERGEGGFVGVAGFEGRMGAAVPEDGEEGFPGGVLFGDELEGFGDDDFGGIALEFLGGAVAAEVGVAVDEVGGGEVFVEAESGGGTGVRGEDGRAGAFVAVEVPFAEVTGAVADFLQGLSEGFFLEAEGVAVGEDTGAVVGAAGEDGGAGGGADGVAGVEAVEAEAVGGHGVEVGGFEEGVLVVAGLTPAHVIGHDEDDVGAGGVGGRGEGGEEEGGEEGEEEEAVHGGARDGRLGGVISDQWEAGDEDEDEDDCRWERGGEGDVSGTFAVVLALAEFGGAAAGLAGEHAGEVVAVGEAVFDGDLVDGFVGEREGFGGEAEAGGEDVGGGGLADVLAEGADEGLEG